MSKKQQSDWAKSQAEAMGRWLYEALTEARGCNESPAYDALTQEKKDALCKTGMKLLTEPPDFLVDAISQGED